MNYFDGFYFFSALIIVLVVYVLSKMRMRYKKESITAISLVFIVIIYSKSPRQLVFLILYLVLEWFNIKYYLRARAEHKRSKPHYYTSLAIALAPLVINKLTEGNINLYAFLGLSYISFKTIGIIIEIYDGLIKEVNLKDYLPFMIFFPTMSSGPIDRYRRFSDDINTDLEKTEYYNLVGTGVFRLVLGYAYKFVISMILYKLLLKANEFTFVELAAYMYIYGFYLFFDFAGYSLMAVGAANVLGIKTPMNFNFPFISLNIKDFWNRWHMSLSYWFRDFVFSRIVKNILKKKIFKNMSQIAFVSYVINMFIMGAWHGLSKSYLLYGLYHGLLLAINEVYEQKSTFYKKYRDTIGYKLVSWFITFQLVMFGFFIFSGRFAAAVNHIIQNWR